MKKMFFALAVVVSMASAANAQVKGKAIGLRFANAGDGAEISFQSPIVKSNRLELDLGANIDKTYGGFQLAAVYQWVWDLEALAPGFNWYAGVGGNIGTYNTNLGIGVLGQIGLEYNFTIPLQISLDWRPTFFNTHNLGGYGYGGNGLSVRYRF